MGGILGPLLVRALGATWSVRCSAPSYFRRRKEGASESRVVYSFWHRDILPLSYYARDEGIRTLISEHRDGELIARVVERMGFTTFRGSTTRGGLKALRAMRRIRKDPTGCDVAITPDGPKGPARKVQKGVIFAAMSTGFPVVPTLVASSRRWQFKSWDGFRIPKPFSRVYVLHGDEIPVPPRLDDDEMERMRTRIENEMYRAEELAESELHRR